mgnify:CR=1 FL=1
METMLESEAMAILVGAGVSYGRREAALRAAGGALAILEEPEAYAAQLQARGVALVRRAWTDRARMLDELERKGMALVPRGDEYYPPLLRHIAHPPHLLYVYGQTDLTDQFPVAVVGTRRASAYGLNLTRQMAAELANVGVCIVSGLALGIDAAAHTGALDAKGRTVAILGSALDQPYPAENRPLMRRILESGGSVVSEYPPGTVPTKYSFLQRNRIIAGMSLGTLVTEGPKRSGALNTAMRTIENGREVFALPGSVDSPGSQLPNMLIGDGARLVTCADDILAALHAVEDINLDIHRGETLGLVGESGCGKSTLGRTLMGIYQPTKGKLVYDGRPVDLSNKKDRFAFAKKAQIVFQDPGSSLNPYQDVRSILSLPLKVHKVVPKNEIDDKILEILEMVELPADFMYKSPNSIGGGEKQLVSIARALCCNPKFIILDEPTSSLDVSIQAKIINMLIKLKKEQNLTYMFITHDMGVMRNVSNRVAIMYLGKICEIAPTETFYRNPLHPYTQMLLSSIPVVSEEDETIKPKAVECVGEIPSPVNVPTGCSFHTRCPYKCERCTKEDPVMREVEPGHTVRCHLIDK